MARFIRPLHILLVRGPGLAKLGRKRLDQAARASLERISRTNAAAPPLSAGGTPNNPVLSSTNTERPVNRLPKRPQGKCPAIPPRACLEDEKELLIGSSFFDGDWYLQHYEDVAMAGIDPVNAYLNFGAKRSVTRVLGSTRWHI